MTSPGPDPAARVITIARDLRTRIGRPDRPARLPIDELRTLLDAAGEQLTTIRNDAVRAAGLPAAAHEPKKVGIAQSGMSRVAPADSKDADREALLVGGLLQGSQRVNPAVVATLLHLVDHRLLIDPATAATWYGAKVAVNDRLALNPATLGRIENGIGLNDLNVLRIKYRGVDPARLEVDLLDAGREAAQVGLHRYSFIMTGQLEAEARKAALRAAEDGRSDPAWLANCLDLVHTVDQLAATASTRLAYAERIATQITDAEQRPALDAVMKAIHRQRLQEAAAGRSAEAGAGDDAATRSPAEKGTTARRSGRQGRPGRQP